MPLGVVLCIPPFNYPVNLAVSKMAPALMAGNCVVVKPPSQGAVSALHMIQAFHKAGFPPGVVQCVTGQIHHAPCLLLARIMLHVSSHTSVSFQNHAHYSMNSVTSLQTQLDYTAISKLLLSTFGEAFSHSCLSVFEPLQCSTYWSHNALLIIVSGKGSEIGDFLTQHPAVNCISFTGGDTGISVSKKVSCLLLLLILCKLKFPTNNGSPAMPSVTALLQHCLMS